MKKILLALVVVAVFQAKGQTPGWAWTKSSGSGGTAYGYSVVVNDSGYVYVAGTFGGSLISFGATTLVTTGNGDIFLVKYNKYGNVVWAKSYGGPLSDGVRSMTLDESGNVVLFGDYYSSSINFGGSTLTNSGPYPNMYIAKISSTGNVVWAKSLGGNSGEMAWSISHDQNNNLIFCGQFGSDSLTLGGFSLYNPGLFILKTDSACNPVWGYSNNMANAYPTSISCNDSGGILLAGYYGGDTLTFGAFNLLPTGPNPNTDWFIVKFDSASNVIWAKSGGGLATDQVFSVASDATGNSVVSGFFKSDSMIVGIDTLINKGPSGMKDIFTVKYDPTGTILWARSIGSIYWDEQINSVAFDDTGNILIAGYFGSSYEVFANDTIYNSGTAPGPWDILIAKYDPFGNEIWCKSAGGLTYNDEALCVSTDHSGNIYATGYYKADIAHFGPTTFYNSQPWDMFVTKIGDVITSTEAQKIKQENVLLLSPNPATTKFKIEDSGFNMGEEGEVEIRDLLGRVVLTQYALPNTQYSISTLPAGIYFVQLKTKEGIATGKLVKG